MIICGIISYEVRKVTLRVSATVDGVMLSSSPVHFTIKGTNPGSAAVKAFVDSQPVPSNWPSGSSYDYHTVMNQILNLESGHTYNQFVANGDPLYNQTAHDGGVGLAQLTPASNDEQVWDWQANVLGGLAVFQSKLDAAVSWINGEVATAQKLAQPIMQQNHLTSLSIQGTPDATVKEAIKRYNGGIGYLLSKGGNKYLASYHIQGQTLVVNWVPAASNDGSYVKLVLSQSDPLVVTTQPPSIVRVDSGFSFVITAENSNGSVNTSFNGSVTVALNNSDGLNGTLGGTLTVQAVNGVATFAGLTVTGPDDPNYYLSASASGLPTVTTNDFDVTAPATELVIVGTPTNVVADGSFTLSVYAKDDAGTTDPSFNGTVTLSLGNNPGGGTLGGTVTATAVDGVAFFTGLRIDNPGSGYTLQASSAGLMIGTSPPLDVDSDQLVITTQPPSVIRPGSSFAVVVAAEDGLGKVDTSFSGSVSIALTYGAGTLGGTLTVTAANGVATFSGLTLDQAADYESLSVTAAGLISATTKVIEVTTAGPATRMVVLPPSGDVDTDGNVFTGSQFSLEVQATDSNGNVDPLFNGTVTLSLGNNPGGSTLGGTLTGTAVNGVAYFTGLTISNPGAGYILDSSSSGLTPGASPPFNVSGDQLVITTQPPSTITAGASFGLVVSAEGDSRQPGYFVQWHRDGRSRQLFRGIRLYTRGNAHSNGRRWRGHLQRPDIAPGRGQRQLRTGGLEQ